MSMLKAQRVTCVIWLFSFGLCIVMSFTFQALLIVCLELEGMDN